MKQIPFETVKTADWYNWHQWYDQRRRRSMYMSLSHVHLCASVCPGCSFPSRARGRQLSFPPTASSSHTCRLQRCLFPSCIMSCGNANREMCLFQDVFSRVSWNVVSGEMLLLRTDGGTERWTRSQWGLSWAQAVPQELFLGSPSWPEHMQGPTSLRCGRALQTLSCQRMLSCALK